MAAGEKGRAEGGHAKGRGQACAPGTGSAEWLLIYYRYFDSFSPSVVASKFYTTDQATSISSKEHRSRVEVQNQFSDRSSPLRVIVTNDSASHCTLRKCTPLKTLSRCTVLLVQDSQQHPPTHPHHLWELLTVYILYILGAECGHMNLALEIDLAEIVSRQRVKQTC